MASRRNMFADVPWRIRDVIWFIGLWLGSQLAIMVGLVLLRPVWPGPAAYLMAAADGDNIVGSLVLAVVNAAAAFVILYWFMRRYGVSWQAVGWRKVNIWRVLGIVAAILVGFYFAAAAVMVIVSALVPSFNANQTQTTEFTKAMTGRGREIAFVALVLLPPVLEETIFRGFLFPALAKRTGVVWGAILSSLLFALAHGQANIGVYTFILGAILCTMYVRFKSIVPGILLHMANNFLAFLALGAK